MRIMKEKVKKEIDLQEKKQNILASCSSLYLVDHPEKLLSWFTQTIQTRLVMLLALGSNGEVN